MDNEFSVSIQNVQQLFSTRFFQPAGVQRSYEWEEDEFSQLLSDLEGVYAETVGRSNVKLGTVDDADSLVDENEITHSEVEDPRSAYFLGEVVIHPRTGDIYDVYDGMQRFTTLTVLLSIFRDRISNEAQKQRLQDLISTGKSSNRLHYTGRDHTLIDEVLTPEATLEIAADDPPSILGRRIRGAKDFFNNHYRDWDEAALESFIDFLLEQAYFSVLEVKSPSVARQIFVTTNKRGKPLRNEDLFIGELADLCENDRIAEQAMNTFKSIRRNLGDDFKPFMRAIAHIETRQISGPGYLADLGDSLAKRKVAPMAWLDQLYKRQIAWDLMKEAQENPAKDPTKGEIWRMGFIKWKEWEPLALYWIDEYHRRAMNNPANESAYRGVLTKRMKRLNRSCVALMLGDCRPPVRIVMVSTALREIAKRKSPIMGSLQLRKAQRIKARRALTRPLTNLETARGLIKWWESILMTENQLAKFHRHISEATLEHVLPRNPENVPDWVEAFPDAVQRNSYKDMLGNLAALDKVTNNKVTNAPYKRKLKAFRRKKQQCFKTLKCVSSNRDWTPEVIEDRTARYVEAIWAYLDLPDH